MNVGDRIRERRKNIKITQGELASMTNRTTQVISNWERGYTPVIPHDDLLELAIALETTPNYLLGITDDPAPLQPKEEKPTYEEYVLSAPTFGEASLRIFELNRKYDLDKETFSRLHELIIKEYGLESAKTTELAAHTKKNVPASGVFKRSDKKRGNKR